MPESFRFPKPIPRDTPAKIAVAMTENMRSLEVWLNNILVPDTEGGATAHADLTGVGTSDHHARYTDAEAISAVGPTGESDHGALSGLADDDHTQYLLKTGGSMTGAITSTAAFTGANVEVTSYIKSPSWLSDPSGSSLDFTDEIYFLTLDGVGRFGVYATGGALAGDIFFANTSGTITLRWDQSDNRWEFSQVPTIGGVDAATVSDLNDYLPEDGTGAMTGDLDMGGNTIDDTSGKGIVVQKSTNQTIGTASLTAIVWQTEVSAAGGGTNWDDIGGTNPTRVTVDEAGWYIVNAQVYWDGSTPGGHDVQVVIYKNGVAQPWRVRTSHQAFMRQQASAPIELAANDYIEMFVWQNSGGNLAALATGTMMGVTRIA